jgi:hypothetical protein
MEHISVSFFKSWPLAFPAVFGLARKYILVIITFIFGHCVDDKAVSWHGYRIVNDSKLFSSLTLEKYVSVCPRKVF